MKVKVMGESGERFEESPNICDRGFFKRRFCSAVGRLFIFVFEGEKWESNETSLEDISESSVSVTLTVRIN